MISQMSKRKGVIGAVAAVVLVVGTLWATGALDRSKGATTAASSGDPILHEGEVLELADDGMTLVAKDTTTRRERTLARCTDCAYVRRFEPSAGGRWLAYEALTCDPPACWPPPPGAGLWVVGAHARRIHVGGGGSAWAWSPTTEQLAVVGTRKDGHGTELVVLDPSTGERTSLASTEGAIYALAWSPDGSTIAYATSLVGFNLVRPGASYERIPGAPAPSLQSGSEGLVWSPDGTRLAVTTEKAGVVVVRIDGSGKRTVLDRQPQHIAWSPDGRRLAFVDGHDVGVVSASGGAPLLVAGSTRTPSFWSGLAWSPDGTLVAYTQGAGGGWYAVPADGSAIPPQSAHIDRLQVDGWIQGR
jgi:Tol biopolymer transport system component